MPYLEAKVYIRPRGEKWAVYLGYYSLVPVYSTEGMIYRKYWREYLRSCGLELSGAKAIGRATARLHQAQLIDTSQTVTN